MSYVQSVVDPVERVRPRCDVCGKRIEKGESFSGIHHVEWKYAVHEECP